MIGWDKNTRMLVTRINKGRIPQIGNSLSQKQAKDQRPAGGGLPVTLRLCGKTIFD
jgi:hypothetical protein